MAKQTINLGTTPGDGAGDPLRAAFDKVNDNFDEVYAGIDGKAPTSHTHAIADVTGLQTALNGKAATSHTHAIADVTGLQDDLDGKASTTHGHAIADVTGLQDDLDGKAATSHTHAIADVTGLQDDLDGKASTTHGHAIADVTGLQDELDGKAATTHGHAIADVTGLQDDLDGKASTSHTHAIADVTGLQDDLDGKASTSHTHAIADVTGLQDDLDGKAATTHGHAIADVTGLQDDLDGKASTSHTHAIADVTGLQDDLDGKAATTHGHAIADVTGLQDDLDGKAATTHGHAIADVTGLQDELDGKAATTHGHAIADVTDLQDELDGKLATAGGTLEEDAEITFANGSKLKVGTTDAGTGGAGGLSQVCSIQYEKKWEAGATYVMEQDGATIRTLRDALGAPGATHDETKGFVVGTRWIQDNGDAWICRDATEDEAVWEAVCDCEIGVALSDETTDLATGTAVVKFSMPYAMYVRDLFLCCSTAPTGAAIEIDAKVGGASFGGGEIPISSFDSIGNSGVDPGLLARGSVISFDVTAVGSTIAGKGLKVWLRGSRR
jgi:hypothetical protein